MQAPASPDSRTGDAVEGPLPQSRLHASSLSRAVRPGTASARTSDAPFPEGRCRDRRKPTGPNTVIARPGVATRRPGSVLQGRTGHAEDHVADRGLRLQRFVPAQGRDIRCQAGLGGPLDEGDARLGQTLRRRLDVVA